MGDTVFVVQEIEWGFSTGERRYIRGIAKSYDGARAIFEEGKDNVKRFQLDGYTIETDTDDNFYATMRDEYNECIASYRIVIEEMPLDD